MIWNIFKSKEEKKVDKEQELLEELRIFTQKYKQYFNCYAFDGKDLVIYKEPEIKDGEIIMNFIFENTAKGTVNYQPLWKFTFMYDINFLERHRNNFIRIKRQASRLGLELKKLDI